MATQKVDMTGATIGDWEVIAEEGRINNAVAWRVRCKCGAERVLAGIYLRAGRTTSCGECGPRKKKTAAPDWSVLALPGAEEAAQQAARAVARGYPNVTQYSFDDLYQEALILLATRPEMREALENSDLGRGALKTRLVRDLTDLIRPEARRSARTDSYEKLWDDYTRAGGE